MKKALVVGATVGVLLFALLGWPTLWRYDTAEVTNFGGRRKVLVRTHRITGAFEYLSPEIGWINPSLRIRSSSTSATPAPKTSGSPGPYDDLLR